ncbi:MAG TPA: sulfotransferase [Woeseiaceae bacterium]|nr:sulfotransferase [Woeseiaceae bacterium]
MHNESRIREGIALLRSGRIDDAAQLYAGVLEAEPRHAAALHYLGLVRLQQGALPEAERLIGDSLKLEPNNANAWSDLGTVRIRADAPEKSLQSFKNALALVPGHPDALNNMAQALRRLGRFDEARPLLERLAAQKPQAAQVRYALADTLYKSNDVTAAIENYQAAVRLDPDDRRSRTGLGETYEAVGRFREARMQYLAALRREPDSVVALAKLLQLREGSVDTQWVERAERLAGSADVPEEGRTRLNVALAHYLDREQRYDEAFRHLRLGYDAQARREPFDADGYTRAVDHLVETLTHEFYASAPSSGVSSARPIFIVGMPRSGTTLTEQILASHSQVAAGGELSMLLKVSYRIGELAASSEPYPRGLLSVDAASLRLMADQYLEHLETISTTAARVTDKLPFNFMHLGVIALLFPNARIVHCRRQPIDNCLSCYFTSFAEQIRFANRLDTLGRYYVDYHRLMQHWHKVLPVAIFELEYEALVDRTEDRVRALLDYCGLDFEAACLAFERTQRGVRTPSRWQVRQPIYKRSVERWRHYERHLEPLVAELSPVLSVPAGSGSSS